MHLHKMYGKIKNGTFSNEHSAVELGAVTQNNQWVD